MQRLTWNGQLYWMIPLPFPGGEPFASFWNRNHAAGYLNLCFAAVAGLMVAGIRRSPDEWWRPTVGRHPTVRAGLVLVSLAVITLGIVATASRGGIIAGAIACLAFVALCAWSRSAGTIFHRIDNCRRISGIAVRGMAVDTIKICRFIG